MKVIETIVNNFYNINQKKEKIVSWSGQHYYWTSCLHTQQRVNELSEYWWGQDVHVWVTDTRRKWTDPHDSDGVPRLEVEPQRTLSPLAS